MLFSLYHSRDRRLEDADDCLNDIQATQEDGQQEDKPHKLVEAENHYPGCIGGCGESSRCQLGGAHADQGWLNQQAYRDEDADHLQTNRNNAGRFVPEAHAEEDDVKDDCQRPDHG